MKLNSIGQQQFNGSFTNKAASTLANHSKLIAGLAGSSVIGQKIVMSGSEATIGPVMDIAIGKGITKVTNEKGDRTNKSSKAQAIRSFSQSIGGTIVGVAVRGACIFGATKVASKAGEKIGSEIGNLISENGKITKENPYQFTKNASAWGKNIGGAAALVVMMFTNFLIDAPFINWINNKVTKSIENHNQNKANQDVKEVK